MRIATASYSRDTLGSWSQYEDTISAWVAQAAGQKADLLVFPEFAAMELATLDGPGVAGDLEESLGAVSDRLPEADALHRTLAAKHGVNIVAASDSVATPARFVTALG